MGRIMKTSDFDYVLPKSLIAQAPASPRDSSKLMVFDTSANKIYHRHFYDLPDFLTPKDVLVLNRSKVVPARVLFDHRGRECEIFVLKKTGPDVWNVLTRPGKFFSAGSEMEIQSGYKIKVIKVENDGSRSIKANFDLLRFGKTPLPPYIKETESKDSDYQTVYAKEKGSVAAPTAGLHFTEDLFDHLSKKKVSVEEIILHVGLGTFLPVKSEYVRDHKMHSEDFEIPSETAKNLNSAVSGGKRVIAVGTTSVRVIEASFDRGSSGRDYFPSRFGSTDIYIYPGEYKWKIVGGMITNFHLPKSTLLMLVSSFLEHKGVESPVKRLLELYEIAKEHNYRFYSFGDAMLIL